MSELRGVTNNNPGSLIITNTNWKGKIPVSQNTDVGSPRLEQFISMMYGIRALIKNMYSYFVADSSLTLGELAYKWNPDTNPANVEAYTAMLEKFTGWKRNDVLEASRDNLETITKAIIKAEQGSMINISDSDIREAYNNTGLELPLYNKKKS